MSVNQTKMRILACLNDGDFSALQVAKMLGMAQKTIRMHLSGLAKLGLAHVHGSKDQAKIYRLGVDTVPEGQRRCKHCFAVKPETTEFYYFNKRHNAWYGVCWDCKRAYGAKKQAEYRALKIKKAEELEEATISSKERYLVSEVAPGHRIYRVAGGFRPEHRTPGVAPMQGYASSLDRIA